jgi:hypothetical protein
MYEPRFVATMLAVFALVAALTGAVLASRSAIPVLNVVADSGDNPINAPLGPINAPRELFLAC